MRNVIVKTGTTEEYFAGVREIARQIDCGEVPKPAFTLTFEDPGDMFAVMTPARLELFRAAKADPSSITAIAHRLNRDRSTVKKDVDILQPVCLISRKYRFQVMADRNLCGQRQTGFSYKL